MQQKSTKWRRYCKITDEIRIVDVEEVKKSVDFHVLGYKNKITKAVKDSELETTNAIFIKM